MGGVESLFYCQDKVGLTYPFQEGLVPLLTCMHFIIMMKKVLLKPGWSNGSVRLFQLPPLAGWSFYRNGGRNGVMRELGGGGSLEDRGDLPPVKHLFLEVVDYF